MRKCVRNLSWLKKRVHACQRWNMGERLACHVFSRFIVSIIKDMDCLAWSCILSSAGTVPAELLVMWSSKSLQAQHLGAHGSAIQELSLVRQVLFWSLSNKPWCCSMRASCFHPVSANSIYVFGVFCSQSACAGVPEPKCWSAGTAEDDLTRDASLSTSWMPSQIVKKRQPCEWLPMNPKSYKNWSSYCHWQTQYCIRQLLTAVVAEP